MTAHHDKIGELASLGPDRLRRMIAEAAPRTRYITQLRLALLRAERLQKEAPA